VCVCVCVCESLTSRDWMTSRASRRHFADTLFLSAVGGSSEDPFISALTRGKQSALTTEPPFKCTVLAAVFGMQDYGEVGFL
jgi:hypothetical protein